MTCPYTSTRLASRLPTDNICVNCTIRESLERRDAERWFPADETKRLDELIDHVTGKVTL